MVKPTKPLDIYVRVSRRAGRGDEEFIAPELQERDCRAYAEAHGLEVGEVIQDIDVSGGAPTRPGLDRAIARIERGESGGIICAHLDRFARGVEVQFGLARRINDAGGQVRCAAGAPEDWSTPDGELLVTIQGAVAAHYRAKRREDLEKAKSRAIEQGIPIATRPPVGYRKRPDRRLEPDPKAAPLVREVFERRAQGARFDELAHVLEAAGVRTSQGSKTWTRQALHNILSSRVYLGELSYGNPPRYVNEHAHEPIVDIETWQAAQRPNGNVPRRPRSKTPGGRFTLTGIIRCAACGYTLEATSTSRGKRIYRCSRRHAGGMCPDPARIDADVAERAAERAFFEVTAELAAAGTSDPAPELAALEAELRRAEERYARVKASDMQDALGDDWPATVKARRQERDRAAEALGQARAAAASTSADVPDVATLRETWPAMAPADRRKLLAARFGAIAVSGRNGETRLVAYLAGHEPRDLSKRGFAREPGLRPLDAPAGARALPL